MVGPPARDVIQHCHRPDYLSKILWGLCLTSRVPIPAVRAGVRAMPSPCLALAGLKNDHKSNLVN